MSTPIDPIFLTIIFFLVGSVFGSFGNVLIYRLPAGQSIQGRSHCPHCGKKLSAKELLPIVSWMMLRARCKGCSKSISIQYPLVEAAAGVLAVLALFLTQFEVLPSIFLAFALWAMLLIAVIDVRTQLIPDVLTLIVVVSAMAYQWASSGSLNVSGALVGVCFLGLQWLLSRGKWIGTGDIFLASALGLLLGHWVIMVIAIMASYIIGAAISLVLMGLGFLHRKSYVPFGQYLIIGTMIALVWGGKILSFI